MELLKKDIIFKDIKKLKGVGKQLSKYLKNKKIEKIKDILFNLPYSDTDRTKIVNIRNLDVGNIKTNKISINNLIGDNKILMGIDDLDRGVIKTYLPDSNVDFNSSANSSSQILDNIKAKSLTIINEDGDERIFIGTDDHRWKNNFMYDAYLVLVGGVVVGKTYEVLNIIIFRNLNKI